MRAKNSVVGFQASCKITNSILSYAEREGISFVSILESYEEPEEFLSDPHFWMPLEKVEDFLDRTAKLLGDPRAGAFIGAKAPDLQSWGALDSVFKMMTSSKEYYSNLPKFLSYFLAPLEGFKEIEKGETFVRFRMPIARSDAPQVYDYLTAVLENLPKYAGHMPARLDAINDSEILVSWDTAQPSLFGEEPGQVLNPRLVIGLTNQLDTLEKTLEQKNRHIMQLKSEVDRLQLSLETQGRGLGLAQLASGVAHEINNPLSFVLSNLDRFQEYSDKVRSFVKSLEDQVAYLDDRQSGAIKELRASLDIDFVFEEIPAMVRESREGLERVKEIVKDLSSIARPDQSRSDVRVASDVNSLIDSVIKVLSAKIGNNTYIHRKFQLQEKVPVIPVRFSQIVMNLLSNALQAIEGDGVIEITTRKDRDTAVIEVRDDGPGMTPEVQSQIFVPFFTTKEAGKGTGLGLSIARSFVELHRGELTVTSQPGQGATFTVRLPIQVDPNQESLLTQIETNSREKESPRYV